jgi:hypothetical protein
MNIHPSVANKTSLELEFINASFFHSTLRKIFRKHFNKIPVDITVYDVENYPKTEAKLVFKNGIPDKLMDRILKIDPQAVPTSQIAQMHVNDWIDAFKIYL